MAVLPSGVSAPASCAASCEGRCGRRRAGDEAGWRVRKTERERARRGREQRGVASNEAGLSGRRRVREHALAAAAAAAIEKKSAAASATRGSVSQLQRFRALGNALFPTPARFCCACCTHWSRRRGARDAGRAAAVPSAGAGRARQRLPRRRGAQARGRRGGGRQGRPGRAGGAAATARRGRRRPQLARARQRHGGRERRELAHGARAPLAQANSELSAERA